MTSIDKTETQLDLFSDHRFPALCSETRLESPPQSAPAPVFFLQERRVVRDTQNEKRLTRKVLALLEL